MVDILVTGFNYFTLIVRIVYLGSVLKIAICQRHNSLQYEIKGEEGIISTTEQMSAIS